MIETPEAAAGIASFDAASHVAFLALGTNDLARALGEPTGGPPGPGVLAAVEAVARQAASRGLECSVCGDLAADPAAVPAMLSAGVRLLSVPPRALGRVKAAVADTSLPGAG